MKEVKPFSVFYYIRENKGKAFLAIFMMFLAVGILIIGNYIYSLYDTFTPVFAFDDKVVTVEFSSADQTGKHFEEVIGDIRADDKLSCVTKTGYGFAGMMHNSILNLAIGGGSWVFNSVEDMEAVFAHLGIEGDFSNCKDGSVILSEDFAKDKKIKRGNVIGPEFDENLGAEWTVDALIDDGSYMCYYIRNAKEENHARAYVYSDCMEGQELRNYILNLVGDRQVDIGRHTKEMVDEQFRAFFVIFYAVVILIAVVLAVTINSVITGQYLKRIYEFGVYRALGRSKWEITGKVVAEVLGMNLIACILGVMVCGIFTYLINELWYFPTGRYLLYFSELGVKGFLLCDLLVVIPLMISKSRMMCKADITEF